MVVQELALRLRHPGGARAVEDLPGAGGLAPQLDAQPDRAAVLAAVVVAVVEGAHQCSQVAALSPSPASTCATTSARALRAASGPSSNDSSKVPLAIMSSCSALSCDQVGE